jgi:hypothetical protein
MFRRISYLFLLALVALPLAGGLLFLALYRVGVRQFAFYDALEPLRTFILLLPGWLFGGLSVAVYGVSTLLLAALLVRRLWRAARRRELVPASYRGALFVVGCCAAALALVFLLAKWLPGPVGTLAVLAGIPASYLVPWTLLISELLSLRAQSSRAEA